MSSNDKEQTEAPKASNEVLGVKWAPWNVPLERRLQTLAVFLYVAMFITSPIISIVVFIAVLMSQYYWLALGYAAWMYYDIHVGQASSRGGRRFNWTRRLPVWRYFRDFFPISLVKTADLDPEKNYLMGYHPHGILGCGAFCNFASEATGFSEKFKGITPHMLTLKPNFSYPLLRGILLWHGVCDVSKDSINHILTKQGNGNAAIIVIGGAQEALDARPGNYDITLKNRKGFVKLALRSGSSLVPVFSFGENDLFSQADNPSGSMLRGFQERFKNLTGVSPPLFYGRGVLNYTFGMLPYRKPVVTVVGKPIDVPKTEEPSAEDIGKYHQMYMDGLSQLFDDHKEKYGIDKDTKLHFV